MKRIQTLLVINYVMDQGHPLLSHQAQAVNRLAGQFKRVFVITGSKGKCDIPSNVTIFSINWKNGNRIRSSIRFLRIAAPLVLKVRPVSIFSHMTEVQSLLIAPLSKVFGIRHYLWYAHSHRSLYLRWCELMLTGIISSTPGSCPTKHGHRHIIGQAIDSDEYAFILPNNNRLVRLVHVGRFDPSKNIRGIIESVICFQQRYPETSFTQIGNPSTKKAQQYASDIKSQFNKNIIFLDSIQRSNIPDTLREYNCFIHAYRGSLDKALIEATMLGLPVVTLNGEYQNIFGTWVNLPNPSLNEELVALQNLSLDELQRELKLRRKIAEESHSLNNWIDELARILR